MRTLLVLIRIGLKNNFSLSSLLQKVQLDPKSQFFKYFTIFSFTFLYLAILMEYWGFLKHLTGDLKLIGQENAVLSLILIVGQVMVLMLGITTAIAVLYFSEDLEMLTPLPIKPYQIILSKFAIMLMYEYIFLVLFILPGLIFSGILLGFGIGYWLMMPVIFLLLPIIPLGISSLFIMFMMRFINLGRKKELLIALLSVFSSLFFILILTLISSRGKGEGAVKGALWLAELLKNKDSFVHMITYSFPPSLWCYEGLVRGISLQGLIYMVLLFSVSVFFCYVLTLLGHRVFFRGLIGLNEVSARKEVFSKDAFTKNSTTSSIFQHPIWIIFAREWRLLYRNPMNLIGNTVGGFILSVTVLFTSQTGAKLIKFVEKMASQSPIIMILGAGWIMLLAVIGNTAASTAFSKDGYAFWMSKVFPIRWKHQWAGKFLHAYAVGVLGILIAAIIIRIVSHIPNLYLLAGFILAMVGNAIFTIFGMAIDFGSPQFKPLYRDISYSNRNTTFSILFNLFVYILVLILGRLFVKSDLSPILIYIIFLVIPGWIFYLRYSYVLRMAYRRYPEIEV